MSSETTSPITSHLLFQKIITDLTLFLQADETQRMLEQYLLSPMMNSLMERLYHQWMIWIVIGIVALVCLPAFFERDA